MQTGNYDQITRKSLQIKQQEDGCFTRVLSKEANSAANSAVNSSFRVYYGGASGAVPFRWESRPGTPKHTFSDTSIPPLTPPPSFYSSLHSNSMASSKPTLLSAIFPRLLTPKKSRSSSSFSLSSTSSSFSSWSSSRSSSCSSPSTFVKPKFFKRPRFSDIPTVPFDCSFHDNDHDEPATSISPTSTLCFGTTPSRPSSTAFRGCYQLTSVKNAFLSIVGHGSAARGTVKLV